VNNSAISGVTNATLTINPTAVTNSGSYTVIVSNQYGAVTSQVAVLDVTVSPIPPTITQHRRTSANLVANNQAFSVSPQGTPPFVYQWYFGTTRLVDDGVTFSGSTNSTLYITNLQTSNSGSYYLTVSNASATGYSNLLAVLTVQYQAPTIGAGGEPVGHHLLEGQSGSLSVLGLGHAAVELPMVSNTGQNDQRLEQRK